MSTCWHCFWGWAKPVHDIYEEALGRLGGNENVLVFGPSHIVWSDENWDSAEWCLEHFDEFKGDYTEDDLAVCRWSLEELAKLPVSVRCIEPEDYNGYNVELFPPKVETVRH